MSKEEFVTKSDFESFKRKLTRKQKSEDKFNPLRKFPDYLEQIKETIRLSFKKSHTAALSLKRIYFVNEKYERLLPTAADVKEGGAPARFTGQLEAVPIVGDILRTEDNSKRFEVLRREHILYKAGTRPEKIFIILREINE